MDGMRRLGYIAGKDFVLEERFADGNTELLRSQVAELTGLKVKVIVVTDSPALREARLATRTIPIVTTVGSDPVGEGLAASLGAPAGT